MTRTSNHRIRWMAALLLGCLTLSFQAVAETDYDVTMRMVEDEEALDSSFVQEMQIPESINELEYDAPLEPLDSTDIANDARESFDNLSSQARETRDALDSELPGEEILDNPLDGITDPDLSDPDLTDPLPDTGLDLVDDPESTINDTLNQ
ncbi:hypothetical protein SAMN04488073_2303 [Marinobacter gudaonensis]|uniref:Uncharacterized protein n=1 Tax=Marinobacter gudaonensis TaxID=375760 RepID=A0A1I6H4Y6_9GAMM|nr:hypothetical protein [Marinobacter gudaonensis]SFR49498.1 hypothetical protein SAMN04488073_2303 [Marinobacter gudaonensis]